MNNKRSPYHQVLNFYKEFKDLIRETDHFSFDSQKKNGKYLWKYTKRQLEEYHAQLSGEEKGDIFKQYIKLWVNSQFVLDIADTSYAEKYKHSRFGKYSGDYNPRVPMLAGFNLKGAVFGNLCYSDLIFLDVELSGASFKETSFPYSHFEHCAFKNTIIGSTTNLNQCHFYYSSMRNLTFENVELCEVSFNDVDLRGSTFDAYQKRTCVFENCIGENTKWGGDEFILFLKKYKLNKKASPQKVAHALWLDDKNSNRTRNQLNFFSVWVKSEKLAYGKQAVEDVIDKTYIMKK